MVVEQIEKVLIETLDEMSIPVDSMRVILSNRKDLCDYQCDDAFKLAKLFHKSPLSIAEEIVEKLKEREDFSNYFEKVECAPPGFINMTLSVEFINRTLEYMRASKKFGLKELSHPQTIFLDYGGPNVAKPLHVGHMRTAIIGESIKRIFAYAGYKTIADVHLGDYGLQIGEVIYCIQKENRDLNSLTISDLDRIYPAMSALCKEDEAIKEKCATITKELQEGNQEYRKYWKKICEVSCQDIREIYKYF